MIVVPRTWLQHLVAIRGTALLRIWPRLLLTVVVACVLTAMYQTGHWFDVSLTTLPFVLVGLPLGIFLGFRNNASYDRYWEGRKLWGRLVNASRSLTRQLLCFVGPLPGAPFSDHERAELEALHRELVYRLIAYVHAFRHHLRDSDERLEVEGLLPRREIDALAREVNRPVAVLQGLGDRLRLAWMRGWIHSHHLPMLEASLTELTGIQGGCERIKNTPIPTSYTVLIHRIVAVYAFTLPFGIVDQVGVFTPVVVLLIGYAFYGLDAIGDEIENPFGIDDNDLPLAALSRMIEVNLRQRLGESDHPQLLQPDCGVLR